MRRRLPIAPAEGWLTLACVFLICLTMAWAIDDARWVLGRADYLDLLVLAAAGGVLSGFIGPKVGWGRWLTFLIGAVFAALVVPLLTGLIAYPGGAPIGTVYQATADSAVQAYIDIAIRDLSSTSEYLHYVLTLALVVWATSMFASYAVFGHHRPLSAVLVVGVILVANMSLTINDQLLYLVLFSIGSLLLLIRSHVFDEQSEWLRRRIGDPASISSVYLRGGAGFIVVAVTASFVLTQTAASAPLAGAWDGVEDGLIGLSQSVSRFLPTGGSTRAIGLAFGPTSVVQQQWSTSGELAFTIRRNPTDDGSYYWRAWTYDKIDRTGWGQTTSTSVDIQANARIFDQRADDVEPLGRHSFTFTVTPAEFRASTILSPQTPITVDQGVRLTTVGDAGYFATIDRSGGTGPYTVTALTPVTGNDPGQLNLAALRETDTTYPDEIKALYLPFADGMLGPNALKLEAKIRDEAASAAPIDLANQLVDELQSSGYQYQTDLRDLPCESLSTVECFATYKKGFCQYYAATMAVILRDMGIPTRIAQGFLPGSRDQNAATEQVLFSNAHAWVEVYFPGYGWLPFDPTGNNLSQLAPLPSGNPTASGSPRPSANASGSARPFATDREPRDTLPGAGSFGGSSALGPLVAVLGLLLLIVGAVAFLTWQRGPRGGTTADDAYGTVTRIASRFGFGPRPAQTVYEYAGVLSDVLPTVRPELETVARAKVESVYAREILGDERLASLKAAQRRLRVRLLRLAFRRKQRRRR
jgi:transglutaminase-like putative cysteine protease